MVRRAGTPRFVKVRPIGLLDCGCGDYAYFTIHIVHREIEKESYCAEPNIQFKKERGIRTKSVEKEKRC